MLPLPLIARPSRSAQREADFLRHAVAELRKLAPETGEETALATRRTTMMQAKKVADDLRDAHSAVAGPTRRCRPCQLRCGGWSGARRRRRT